MDIERLDCPSINEGNLNLFTEQSDVFVVTLVLVISSVGFDDFSHTPFPIVMKLESFKLLCTKEERRICKDFVVSFPC